MHEKYDERHERQVALMAENKLDAGNFQVFDAGARVVKRAKVSELGGKVETGGADCLVMTNREGATIVLTGEFERVLWNALNNRFE